MIKSANSNGARCEDFFSIKDDAAIRKSRSRRFLLEIWKRRRWLLLFADATVIFGAFLVAYLIRFQSSLQDYFSIKEQLDFEAYFLSAYVRAAVIFVGFWVALMIKDGMYSHRLISANSPRIENRLLLWSGIKSLALLMAISFLFRGFLLSRFVYGIAFAMSLVALVGLRSIGRWITPRMIGIGAPRRRTILIGTNRSSVEFATTLERHSNGSQEVVGFLEFPDERCLDPQEMPGCKILGGVDEIGSLRNKIEFDRVVLSAEDFLGAKENRRRLLLTRLLNYCEACDIPLYLISFSTDVMILRSEMGSYNGVPLLLLRDATQHPTYAAIKRVWDIILSVMVLALGAPLWIAIAIAIKITSKGPVLFIQERIGLNGKPFRMLKFRSMVDGADEHLDEIIDLSRLREPVFKIHNDPRTTRLGRLLRRTSLDEIPQLINVLKGEMSVVGPRPEQSELVLKYNDQQWRRLKSKPGITGYQQIINRGDLSLSRRIEYDLYYLKNQSLLFDLSIMLRTIIVVIRGEGTL